MKKFKFLLLDAGPIIKLFQSGLWDIFIEKCDITITRTVATQAKYASRDFEDICINLDPYEEQSLIKIIDVGLLAVKQFYEKFDSLHRAGIHDGERETLAFLFNNSENWRLCAADQAVFKVLGVLGKGNQGISLEEVLKEIGHQQNLEWQYTKKFREKYTKMGQADSIQNRGLL